MPFALKGLGWFTLTKKSIVLSVCLADLWGLWYAGGWLWRGAGWRAQAERSLWRRCQRVGRLQPRLEEPQLQKSRIRKLHWWRNAAHGIQRRIAALHVR